MIISWDRKFNYLSYFIFYVDRKEYITNIINLQIIFIYLHVSHSNNNKVKFFHRNFRKD